LLWCKVVAAVRRLPLLILCAVCGRVKKKKEKGSAYAFFVQKNHFGHESFVRNSVSTFNQCFVCFDGDDTINIHSDQGPISCIGP
jgi:hypothetical protein